MSRLQIKVESLPQRCEICHKSDRFEPTANHCERCYGVIFDPKSISREAVISVTPRMFADLLIGSAKLGTAAGALIACGTTFLLISVPSPPQAFYVLAVVSGLGGPLMGIFFGLLLNALIMIAKWAEFIHEKIRNITI